MCKQVIPIEESFSPEENAMFKKSMAWFFNNGIHKKLRALNNNYPLYLDQVVDVFAAKERFTKVGRNDPCPCGSYNKFKKCHRRN